MARFQIWKKLRSHEPSRPTAQDGLQDHDISPAPGSSGSAVADRRHSAGGVEPHRDARGLLAQHRQPERGDISNRHSQPSSTTSTHQGQRSGDRQDDPLGLTVLYGPKEPRSVDILFIHGLGGTSLRTWCKDRNLDFLWPSWLPNEADLSTARILTFGYNANFLARKQQTDIISDFATDLLFQMKYSQEGQYRMGQVPIVVVAHSMGGLIFKMACRF